MKKIVLVALLTLAYQASFAAPGYQAGSAAPQTSVAADTSHDLTKSADSKDVSYQVTFSRDNKILKQETLVTKLGSPVSSSLVVTRDSTVCKFKDQTGAPVDSQYSMNDETVMSLVPSALKAGRIETIIDARISRATPKDSGQSGDCMVATGQTRSISVVDFVAMHETDTRTYNLGDGTVMVVKLLKGGAPNGATE